MSLLGPSLHSLNQRHRPAVQAQLGGYARGMLAALEGLHRQGVSQSGSGRLRIMREKTS